MKKKLIIKKTIIASLLMYFVFALACQELTIYRIKEQAVIQKTELDSAKVENVKLTDKAELLKNNPNLYYENLARDMQYIKVGENIVINQKSKN